MLPALRELRLEDEALEMAQITAHLCIPQSISVSICYYSTGRYYLKDLLPVILPVDRSHCSYFADVRKIAYHVDRSLTIDFKFKPTNSKFDLSMETSEQDLEGQPVDARAFNAENREFGCSFLTIKLLPEIPSLNAIEEIQIVLEDGSAMQTSHWNTMFKFLPSLHDLSYQYSTKDRPLEGFKLLESLVQELVDGSCVCPNLESLQLQDFVFETDSMVGLTPDEQESISKDGVTTVDLGLRVVDCLRHRESKGHRLQPLTLMYTPKLKEETVELMRVHVDELRWVSAKRCVDFSSLDFE